MADERRSNRPAKPAGRGGRPGGQSGAAGRGGKGRAEEAPKGARRGSQGPKPFDKGGKPTAGASGAGRPGPGKSGAGKAGAGKAGAGKTGAGKSAAGKGARDFKDGKPGARTSYGSRDGARGGSREGSREGRRSFERRPEREVVERTSDQRAYDGPDLPVEITGKELDRAIASQLRGLPEKLANRVARHLVAAGMYIEENPELAYQHAKAAKARTQRLAVIREALGEAAYAAGHYAEALAELRAAKRMNGATAYLPIMADCHRALGQPQQAIKLAHSPSVANFPVEAKAEMTIVEAGARRDMKQYDAALRILEMAPLNNKGRAAWVVRLRYAYADTLEAAGRTSDALEWFHRTYAIDSDELTDAAARAEALEKQLGD